jgi:hypothetical protein
MESNSNRQNQNPVQESLHEVCSKTVTLACWKNTHQYRRACWNARTSMAQVVRRKTRTELDYHINADICGPSNIQSRTSVVGYFTTTSAERIVRSGKTMKGYSHWYFRLRRTASSLTLGVPSQVMSA